MSPVLEAPYDRATSTPSYISDDNSDEQINSVEVQTFSAIGNRRTEDGLQLLTQGDSGYHFFKLTV